MIRFRLEVLASGLFAILAIVTAIWPTWIEAIFNVSPDGRTGESEWWIVVLLGLLALTAALLARRDYATSRRGSLAGETPLS